MTKVARPESLLAPFSVPVFRRIWSASLLSNFGILIQGVGAAWTMARMTDNATMVALVQTALMLPIMLIALPAGAISDMFDRRLVCIAALSVALAGGIGLCVVYWLGVLTPPILLGFCFLVGSGMAMFGPAWQASVGEQVPPETLPSAIALNGISFNVARSFGPAIGGVLVAWVGAIGAFVANAVFYLPLLVVLVLWKRGQEPARLAPESFGRAIVSGARFIRYSPAHRLFMIRTLIFGLIGGVIPALMPLIARTLLQGGAPVYGVLLGVFGMGAVVGAVTLPWMRARFSTETSSRISAVAIGLAVIVIAFSRVEAITLLALLVAGIAWTNVLTLYSISIQISAPRWVSGRALAIYQATTAGGVGLGSWGWGQCAERVGVADTLLIAGAMMTASALLGLWLKLPDLSRPPDDLPINRAGMAIGLDITPRSGPIVIEIDYVVPLANARAFYEIMQRVRRYRQRTGAYGWSIARDISMPERWTERFHAPTWNDYQHLIHRSAVSGRGILEESRTLLDPSAEVVVRRMLERPAGSVRWKEETPDRGLVAGTD